MDNKIRIIVIDDDESWLKSFTQFLSHELDLYIVGTASNKAGALQLVKTHEADFVLLDLNLEEQRFEGISLTKEINQIKKIKVIIITAFEAERLMKESILAGAISYYPKSKFKDIPNVLRLEYNNISPIEILYSEYYKLKKEIAIKDLSLAEREVFELLLFNYSAEQISEKLNKTEGTIKNQISSIFKKLQIKNRQQMHEKYSTYKSKKTI